MQSKPLLTIVLLLFTISSQGQQRKLDSLITELKEHPAQDEQHLKTLNSLSYVYASMQIDSGIAKADKAIALAQKLNSQLQLAAAYNNKVFLFYKAGKNEEAYSILNKSFSIFKNFNDDNGLALCYIYLSGKAINEGNFKQAMAFCDSSFVLFKKTNNANGLGEVALNKAYLNRNDNDTKAAALFKEAEAYYVQAGNESGQALALISHAATQRNISGNKEWLLLLDKATALSERIQDYYAMYAAYGNYAIYYSYISNYPLSVKYNLKTLKLAEQIGDILNGSYAYISLADVYYYAGDYDKAIMYALIGDSLSRQIKNIANVGSALNYLGMAYIKTNENKKALKALTEMQQIFSMLKNELNLATSYCLIAECYFQMGDYKTALANFNKGMPVFLKIKEKFLYAEAAIPYSKTIYNANDKELTEAGIEPSQRVTLAVDYLKKAYQTGKEEQYINMQRDAMLELSIVYDKEGDTKKSFDCYKQYVVLKDSIMNTANTYSIANMQVEYDTEKKEQQIALLNKDKALQHTEIEKQKTTRNAFMGGIALVLLITGVTYNRYRVKQKANTAIENTLALLKNTQQQIIEQENLASLGKFTAATAKEIESPLNYINHFAALNNELLFKMNTKQDDAVVDNILTNLQNNFKKINQYGKNADGVVKKVLVNARTVAK